jgi:hypothetical protein
MRSTVGEAENALQKMPDGVDVDSADVDTRDSEMPGLPTPTPMAPSRQPTSVTRFDINLPDGQQQPSQ